MFTWQVQMSNTEVRTAWMPALRRCSMFKFHMDKMHVSVGQCSGTSEGCQ